MFIFIVDDWNWKDVRDGTRASFQALNLKVLYEKEIFTQDQVKETWWNGIYVAILHKSVLPN
jgi:hypothetical protein